MEMVIKPSPQENKKKQALPAPGPGHKRSSSRQMGVDVNEAPSRISRMEMDPSLSDGQTIPLAYYYGGFPFFEYRESRTGLVGGLGQLSGVCYLSV